MEDTAMEEKKLATSPGLTPDWLKKRTEIMRAIDEQLVLGLEGQGTGLTLDQLEKVVEHNNPFEKGTATFAEVVRAIQMKRLKVQGYSLNEDDVPLPDMGKLQLGLAILVDYSTPINTQCRLLRIRNLLSFRYPKKDLYPKPQGRWGWIYGVKNGEDMLGRSPSSATKELGICKRRGLMTVEGLALYRENPYILTCHPGPLKNHSVDFSGSRCGKFESTVPCLRLNDVRPNLCDFDEDLINPETGSASTVIV